MLIARLFVNAFRGAVLAVRGPNRRGHKKVLQWAPVSVNIKTVLNFVVLWIKRKGGGPPLKGPSALWFEQASYSRLNSS